MFHGSIFLNEKPVKSIPLVSIPNFFNSERAELLRKDDFSTFCNSSDEEASIFKISSNDLDLT